MHISLLACLAQEIMVKHKEGCHYLNLRILSNQSEVFLLILQSVFLNSGEVGPPI